MTIAAGLILTRLIHYCAVSVLFGAGAFPLYATGLPLEMAFRQLHWLRGLQIGATLISLASAILWLVFAAMGSTGLLASGGILAARLTLTVALATLLMREPTRLRIRGVLIGSAILLVSLAALGHSAAGDGLIAVIHVVADALHLLAASIWIGALVAFVIVLAIARRSERDDDAIFARNALDRFSEIGGIVVGVLLFSGLMNPNVLASLGTRYGQVLVAKILIFVAMLLFAAANRFWLTPRLAAALASKAGPGASLDALRISILAETALAILAMAAVAVLASLSPPAG